MCVWGEGMMGVKKAGQDGCQESIHKHAALVQVFAPGIATYDIAKYYELILERPLS